MPFDFFQSHTSSSYEPIHLMNQAIIPPMKQRYTLLVFSEPAPDMLARISGLLTRRGIVPEYVTAAQNESEEMIRLVFVLRVSADDLLKVIKQIEKLTDVLKVEHF